MGGFKPSIDHTDGTSNGAYMIVDISQSSSTIINQRARLISPVITPNGEQCVEFWYYSDSDALSSASKLSVFVRTNYEAKNSSSYLIWSKNILQVRGFDMKDKKKKIWHFFRNVNGGFHNNEFHMVLVRHRIRLFLKVLFLNLVRIHQSLLLMMCLFVIELVLIRAIVILKMGNLIKIEICLFCTTYFLFQIMHMEKFIYYGKF